MGKKDNKRKFPLMNEFLHTEDYRDDDAESYFFGDDDNLDDDDNGGNTDHYGGSEDNTLGIDFVKYHRENPDEVPYNKKAQTLNRIADAAIDCLCVRTTGNQNFLLYDASYGYFYEKQDICSRLCGFFHEYAPNLTTKDWKEIQNLIAIREGIQVDKNAINSNVNLINMRSNVIDWREMEVLNHASRNLFSYYIDADIMVDTAEEQLETPALDGFFETSLENDDKKIEFVLEMIGYCLSDCCDAKCAFFLVGAANSGKSILLSFITRLMGEGLTANLPLHRLSEKFARAELVGKKLNVAGELSGKALHDISTYKSLTGNDRIEAERKGSAVFFFQPKAKMIFSGNCFPQVKENDVTDAFTNRMALLIFPCSIAKEAQDKDLLEKLWNERNDIVTKAIWALRRLAQRNFAFDLPSDSLDYIAQYKNNQNSVVAFISDCCVLEEKATTSNVVLYEAYKTYCKTNGFELIGRTKCFEITAGFMGVTIKKCRTNGGNIRCHVGLRIKTA